MTSLGWAKLWPYALSLSLHGALLGAGAALYLAERRPSQSIPVVRVHIAGVAPREQVAAAVAPGSGVDDGTPILLSPSAATAKNEAVTGDPFNPSAVRTVRRTGVGAQSASNVREPNGTHRAEKRSPTRSAPTPPRPRSSYPAPDAGESNPPSISGQGSDSHANGAGDSAPAGQTGAGESAVAFPPSSVDTGALVASVRDGIDAVKRYPRMARQAGQQGRALIKFRLLYSGAVTDLRVIDSSGFPILDDAALSAVRRAAPFADQGRRIGAESIEVVLPVVFRLR